MPSSSARCSQLPRAIDKAPFYVALKKLRDHLSGLLPQLEESEVIFPDLELKVEPKRERESSVDVVKRKMPLCNEAANKRNRHAKHGLATETVPSELKVQLEVLTEIEKCKQAKQMSLNSNACGSNSHVAHSFCPSASVNTVNSTFPLSSAVVGMSSSCDSFTDQRGSVLSGGMTVLAGETYNTVKAEVPFDLSQYGSLNYQYQGYSAHGKP